MKIILQKFWIGSSNSYFLWDFASLLKTVSFRPFLHGVDVVFPENNQKRERKS